MLATKLGRKELIDKRDIVVERPHFKNFLSPEAESHVPVFLCIEIVAIFPVFAELAFVPAVFNVAIEFYLNDKG